jgi:glucose/arabinose dehydrogenase
VRRPALALAVTGALVLAAVAATASARGRPDVTPPLAVPPHLALRPVATGFTRPVQVLAAPGEPPRLYVVELDGLVRTVERGRVRPRPFLDLRRDVRVRGEQGLLGIAFHPAYAVNRRLVAHFTGPDGATRVAEYRVREGRVDRSSRRDLLRVEQRWDNHQGGGMAFGPDGRLWLALGDGGSGRDPLDRSQDPDTHHGKLLRLDVDRPDARWEMLGRGLRNPWRLSFDRLTGDLWIGDVGQERSEEVDALPPSTRWPVNFGWPRYEGRRRLLTWNPLGRRLRGGDPLVEPVLTYPHGHGNASVTGGYVYRGGSVPGLQGRYVFGDFMSGRVWSVGVRDARPVGRPVEEARLELVSAFGEDAGGELHVVTFTGSLLRVVAPARPAPRRD